MSNVKSYSSCIHKTNLSVEIVISANLSWRVTDRLPHVVCLLYAHALMSNRFSLPFPSFFLLSLSLSPSPSSFKSWPNSVRVRACSCKSNFHFTYPALLCIASERLHNLSEEVWWRLALGPTPSSESCPECINFNRLLAPLRVMTHHRLVRLETRPLEIASELNCTN